jgi:hypothetical protein
VQPAQKDNGNREEVRILNFFWTKQFICNSFEFDHYKFAEENLYKYNFDQNKFSVKNALQTVFNTVCLHRYIIDNLICIFNKKFEEKFRTKNRNKSSSNKIFEHLLRRPARSIKFDVLGHLNRSRHEWEDCKSRQKSWRQKWQQNSSIMFTRTDPKGCCL